MSHHSIRLILIAAWKGWGEFTDFPNDAVQGGHDIGRAQLRALLDIKPVRRMPAHVRVNSLLTFVVIQLRYNRIP